MKHKDGFFTGAHKAKIYCQSWLPCGDPVAIIVVSHGLAEHSGRYINLVNRFVPLGYAIYSLDHLGHGKSEGRRAYVNGFGDFTHTLDMFISMVTSWQQKRPIFLLGHSMGALIAIHLLLDDQRQFSGAILSGPSVVLPKDISRHKIAAARILSTLIPTKRLLALDASAVSKDHEVVNAYISDPLVYNGKITARLGYELLAAMKYAMERALKITLPVLILQGDADKLVDPGGAHVLYDSIGSTDKKLNVYNGLYHEVLNEPEREHVLDDVQAWLEAHLA